jgi:hypothetical protein
MFRPARSRRSSTRSWQPGCGPGPGPSSPTRAARRVLAALAAVRSPRGSPETNACRRSYVTCDRGPGGADELRNRTPRGATGPAAALACIQPPPVRRGGGPRLPPRWRAARRRARDHPVAPLRPEKLQPKRARRSHSTNTRTAPTPRTATFLTHRVSIASQNSRQPRVRGGEKSVTRAASQVAALTTTRARSMTRRLVIPVTSGVHLCRRPGGMEAIPRRRGRLTAYRNPRPHHGGQPRDPARNDTEKAAQTNGEGPLPGVCAAQVALRSYPPEARGRDNDLRDPPNHQHEARDLPPALWHSSAARIVSEPRRRAAGGRPRGG